MNKAPSTYRRKTRYKGILCIGRGKYVVRVRWTDPKTGRARDRKAIIHGSLEDARAKQDELRENRACPERAGRMTLHTLIDSWLTSYCAGLRPKTVTSYVMHMKRIARCIGEHYVDALTPTDIEAFQTQQIEAGIAGATIQKSLGLLRRLSHYAREVVRVADHDFCATVRLRKVCNKYTEDEPNSLTIEQLNRLLQAVPEKWFPHFATLAHTGVRVGEMLGLQWDDIDFARGVIHIRRTNSQGYIGAPKTAQGRRTIAMAPELAEILANYRQSLLAAQHPSLTKGWLFAKDDGEHYYSSPLRKPLLKALKRAGILFRFTCHGFRRTYNDLLQRVAKERVVRDILGHRRPEMTAHYSTIRMNEKQEAATRMFQLIQGGQRSRCTETGTLREDFAVCPQCNAEFSLDSNSLQGRAPDGA